METSVCRQAMSFSTRMPTREILLVLGQVDAGEDEICAIADGETPSRITADGTVQLLVGEEDRGTIHSPGGGHGSGETRRGCGGLAP